MITINLGQPEKAILAIKELGKRPIDSDVRFQNVHLCEINKLIGRNIFRKNDLFIDCGGLWDLLQEPDTASNHHHHHGLNPDQILYALSKLRDPELIVQNQWRARYVIVTLALDGRAMLAVIEVGAALRNNRDAKVNKLVTLYEKQEYEKFLCGYMQRSDISILYKK